MEEVGKKNLLIFFGELRTFEYVVPHLKRLDDVDIIISTWNESNYKDISFSVNEETIKNIIPNIKQIHILNQNDFKDKSNTWKMFYHWKIAINNILNPNQYQNVIVHRTDLISNWHDILDMDIEENLLYIHHNDKPYYNGGKMIDFWVSDYYFFGKLDIVKKFINLLDKDEYERAHFPLYEVIIENNIKYKKHIFKGFLGRDSNYLLEYINKGFPIPNSSYLQGPNEQL